MLWSKFLTKTSHSMKYKKTKKALDDRIGNVFQISVPDLMHKTNKYSDYIINHIMLHNIKCVDNDNTGRCDD